jgi:uncharacterized protein (TIGR00255 family)
MTGFGEAHRQDHGVAVAVEVRSINSKYFKLTFRAPEGYAALESEVEQLVRRQVRRGTLQVNLRIDRPRRAEEFRINVDVLEGYRWQLDAIGATAAGYTPLPLDKLLLLPGVVEEHEPSSSAAEQDWPLVSATLEEALASLARMRTGEGRAMAADLAANIDRVAAELTHIEARAPQVAEGYRARMLERVRSHLAEHQVKLDPGDLIREVSLFAERSDISEETVRLRSHLAQFRELLSADDSAGRTLEFLTQEMFREINTIGSKSSDVEVSRHAIEIKAAIERVREMIQNVE